MWKRRGKRGNGKPFWRLSIRHGISTANDTSFKVILPSAEAQPEPRQLCVSRPSYVKPVGGQRTEYPGSLAGTFTIFLTFLPIPLSRRASSSVDTEALRPDRVKCAMAQGRAPCGRQRASYSCTTGQPLNGRRSRHPHRHRTLSISAGQTHRGSTQRVSNQVAERRHRSNTHAPRFRV